MITPPERSDARDAAIDAVLPLVAERGWTLAALRQAAGAEAELLFPGGPADMVETYIDVMDRRMVAAAAPVLATQRLSQRVRTLVAARLALAHPSNALLSARCTARTVDAIWHAAGDTSADFSWYTKRAILAAVYSATLLYWLNDATTEEAALAFLDRRLAGVARIGKLRARLTGGRKAPRAA